MEPERLHAQAPEEHPDQQGGGLHILLLFLVSVIPIFKRKEGKSEARTETAASGLDLTQQRHNVKRRLCYPQAPEKKRLRDGR